MANDWERQQNYNEGLSGVETGKPGNGDGLEVKGVRDMHENMREQWAKGDAERARKEAIAQQQAEAARQQKAYEAEIKAQQAQARKEAEKAAKLRKEQEARLKKAQKNAKSTQPAAARPQAKKKGFLSTSDKLSLAAIFLLGASVMVGNDDDKPQYQPNSQEPSTYTAPTSVVNPNGISVKSAGEKVYEFRNSDQVYPIYEETDGFKKGDLKNSWYLHRDDIRALNYQLLYGKMGLAHYKAAVDNLNVNVRYLDESGRKKSLMTQIIDAGFSTTMKKAAINLDEDVAYIPFENANAAVRYLLDRGFYSEDNHEFNKLVILNSFAGRNPSLAKEGQCLDEDLFKKLIPAQGMNAYQYSSYAGSSCERQYKQDYKCYAPDPTYGVTAEMSESKREMTLLAAQFHLDQKNKYGSPKCSIDYSKIPSPN